MALYIVATPLGTLDDLSPRARELLGRVSLIASEDTRTTRALLNAVGIPAPHMVALHAHNEEHEAERVAERASREDVALVCDAGTPGISDPGARLVTEAHRRGVEIRSVPGPSALAAALAASGLPAAPSSFLGFPPRKGRAGWVEGALASPDTLVIYEAPSRVAELASLLAERAPDREACLCRELSKRFEEVLRLPLPALASALADRELLGECVLVVGPGAALRVEVPAVAEDAGLKEIAAALAVRWGVTRREAYQRLLSIEEDLRR